MLNAFYFPIDIYTFSSYFSGFWKRLTFYRVPRPQNGSFRPVTIWAPPPDQILDPPLLFPHFPSIVFQHIFKYNHFFFAQCSVVVGTVLILFHIRFGLIENQRKNEILVSPV